MRFSQGAALGFGAVAQATVLPKTVIGKRYETQPERVQAIKDAFHFSWSGYYEHAFPNDNLHPVSSTFDNNRYVLMSPRTNFGQALIDFPGTAGASLGTARLLYQGCCDQV